MTGFSPDPQGSLTSPEPYRGAMSPEIPKENSDSQAAQFNFDPSETVIVVRRKRDSTGRENSVMLKSLLKNRSLLTNSVTSNINNVKAGRIEKIRAPKR